MKLHPNQNDKQKTKLIDWAISINIDYDFGSRKSSFQPSSYFDRCRRVMERARNRSLERAPLVGGVHRWCWCWWPEGQGGALGQPAGGNCRKRSRGRDVQGRQALAGAHWLLAARAKGCWLLLPPPWSLMHPRLPAPPSHLSCRGRKRAQ